MTLFGVGLKIDAKAATPTFTPSVVTNWTSSGTAFTGSVEFDISDFDGIDDPATSGMMSNTIKHYVVQIKESTAGPIGTKVDVYLWKYNNGSNVEKHYANTAPTTGTEGTVATGPFPSGSVTATISDVVGTFNSRVDTNENITKYFLLDYTFGQTSSSPVTSYKVNCEINPSSATGVNIAIRAGEKQSLLPGETTVVEAFISTQNNTYRFNTWESLVNATHTSDGFSNNKAYQEIEKNSTGGEVTVKAKFTNDASLSIPGVNGQSFSSGQSISTGYTFTGYKSGQVTGTGGGMTATGWGADSYTGTFTATAPTTAGSYTMSVTMQDGNVFKLGYNVYSPGNVHFSDDPICVTEGQNINLFSWTDSATGLELINSLEITGKAKGKVQILVGNTNYKNSLGVPTVLSSIKIKGIEPTTGTRNTTGLPEISMVSATTDEANITVYPKPLIEINASGGSSLTSSTTSNSSTDSPIKITMPTAVYYDDVQLTKIGSARIKFSTSKKSKEETIPISKTVGDDGLAKYEYLNSSALISLLDDLCDDDDSKIVTVKVWPYDDDTVYDEKTFNAYRISLDTSAGAKYTVNGNDVGGHFYGIEGTKYTIKASAANGGTLDRNNSGEFNNGETITYKVAGTKTLKAVYNNGNSSPSSSGKQSGANGESMGDGYDDVPKTGESKTDIWILWTVLFISIIGAGFLIWKRFGLARAIAEADEAVAHAEYEEQVKAAEKEKQEKLDMLKDLRNL